MKRLHPPQLVELERALAAPRPLRWIYGNATGTGKTPLTLETLKALGAQRILVATPAIVRDDWKTRITEWWPERRDDVGIITCGRTAKTQTKAERAAYAAPIQIYSWELLKHAEQAENSWDAIVFDEAQYLSNPRSIFHKNALILRRANLKAHFLSLSATPAQNKPEQIWGILATLQLGAWGKATSGGEPDYNFRRRYCVGKPSEYATSGMSYAGSNPLTAQELQDRMTPFMSRLTRKDLAEYLPRCDVSPLYLASTDRRTDLAVAQEWLKTAQVCATHPALFVYHKDVANQLYLDLCEAGLENVFLLTGDEPAKARRALLRAVEELPSAILVATMRSVGVGISLTWVKEFLALEWAGSPGQLTQLLGRFERLDSVEPARGQFLIRRGTPQEDAAQAVVDKITAINRIVKSGEAEEKLLALFNEEMSEDQFRTELATLCATYVPSDLLDDDSDTE